MPVETMVYMGVRRKLRLTEWGHKCRRKAVGKALRRPEGSANLGRWDGTHDGRGLTHGKWCGEQR